MIQALPKPKSQKEAAMIQRIRNRVDYSREREGKPYSFNKDASFSDCQLPSVAEVQPRLKDLYLSNVVDEDMKADLEGFHSLNYFPQAMTLLPVSVSKDGNCLLHAASVAVWGVEDSKNTLRDLMLMTVKSNPDFKKRWWSQLMRNLRSLEISQPDVFEQEWNDVIRSISNLGSSTLSIAVPHRFLEDIHIYILANILRRPIIVITNGSAKSLAGHDLQENHIGGLYLPLEWPPIECCKTPIVLGYSYSHFCPLLSESQPPHLDLLSRRENPLVFPLVHSDLSFLLVRYLKEEEEPQAWILVQSYLLVKEIDVVQNLGTVTKAPFVQMHLHPLEPEQNTLFEHFELLSAKFLEAEHRKAYSAVETSVQNIHPFHDIEMSSQTEVVPVSTMKATNKNIKESQSSFCSPLVNKQQSDLITQSQCIFKGCSMEGSPYLQNFCANCFKILAESSPIFAPPKEGNFVKDPTALSKFTLDNSESNTVIPTAPLMSLEPPSENASLLSMMSERCRNNCGYRCSRETYPYCHECHQIEIQKMTKLREKSTVASYPHKTVDNVVAEPRYEGKTSLVGTEEMGYPKEFESNHTLQNSVVSPLQSTNTYNLPHFSSSENSWQLESEGKVLLYNLLSDQSKILPSNKSEIKVDQNCKNYERCSGQKMLDHNICFSCAEDQSLQSNIEYFWVEPNLQSTPGRSATLKENGTISHVEQASEGKGEKCSEEYAESFAETDINISSGDIEVSEEPDCKVKCASFYCDTYIVLPDKLCDRCMDILKKGYEKSQQDIKSSGAVIVSGAVEDQFKKEKFMQKKLTSNLKQLKTASKGKPCIVPECPNYGDPQMDDKCSLCFYKSNPFAKPQQPAGIGKTSGRISNSGRQSVTEQKSYKDPSLWLASSQSKQQTQSVQQVYNKSPEHLSSAKMTETHHYSTVSHANPPPPAYPSTYHPKKKHARESFVIPQTSTNLSPSEPKSIIVTSKTGHSIHESLHSLPFDSSYSFNKEADKKLDRAFQGIEKTWKSSANKCLSNLCENFGNISKEGYCNACYRVIRRQRILEQEVMYGVDVPDGAVLEST